MLFCKPISRIKLLYANLKCVFIVYTDAKNNKTTTTMKNTHKKTRTQKEHCFTLNFSCMHSLRTHDRYEDQEPRKQKLLGSKRCYLSKNNFKVYKFSLCLHFVHKVSDVETQMTTQRVESCHFVKQHFMHQTTLCKC